MNSTLRILACIFVFGMVAQGDIYNFDSTPVGTYQSLNLPGVEITFPDGNTNFEVAAADPGPPISGHSLLSYYTNPGLGAFKVRFTGSVTSFTITGGDHNFDTDYLHLRAYDASNNLIGFDDQTVPFALYGGVYVSVLDTSVDIAYVRFWSSGEFPGSVFWDDMRTNADAVPEPATFLLMGTVAANLWIRNRRKARS